MEHTPVGQLAAISELCFVRWVRFHPGCRLHSLAIRVDLIDSQGLGKVRACLVGAGRVSRPEDVKRARYDEALGYRPRSVRPG
jgi:hypothetical protein